MSGRNQEVLMDFIDKIVTDFKNIAYHTEKRDPRLARKYKNVITDIERAFSWRNKLDLIIDTNELQTTDEDSASQNITLFGESSLNPNKLNCSLDSLGWGLSGVAEDSASDHSVGSTSTSSDDELPRRPSYTRHKILRQLRRKPPKPSEFNVFSSTIEQFLSYESKKSCSTNSESTIINNKSETFTFPDVKTQFDDYANSRKISVDKRLTNEYTTTQFNTVCAVIDNYQSYLQEHPKEFYANITELMLRSEFKIDADVNDLSHYYNTLNKTNSNEDINTLSPSSNVRDTKESIPEASYSLIQRSVYNNDDFIAEEIKRSVKTGILDLKNRNIINVPFTMWNLYDIAVEKTISPSEEEQNFLSSKRDAVESYKLVTTLDLSRNLIENISPMGSCFNTLLVLNLSGNRLKNVSYNFGEFIHLKYLDLSDNQLSNLPGAIGGLKSLNSINLNNNNLTELPNSIGAMKQLKILDVRWNKLTSLPSSIVEIISLRIINAGSNKMCFMPSDFKKLKNLVILDVSYNKLSSLPLLEGLNRLNLVNAMGNDIKEIPNLRNCKNLYELRLDGNRLRKINIGNLESCPIVQFTASYNKIVELPVKFYTIETLVVLDLISNRLTWLPWSLARLKCLTCVRVDMNPIQNIDPKILASGSKKIINFLIKKLLEFYGTPEMMLRNKNNGRIIYVDGDPRAMKSAPSKSAPLMLEKSSSALNPIESVLQSFVFSPVDKDIEASVQNHQNFVNREMKLSTLSDKWIKKAIELKVLSIDLSVNKFRYLPPGLKSLAPFLESMFLNGNCLRTIPDFIGRMKSLHTLDLSGNHLNTLPTSLRDCSRLSKLVCNCNYFIQIPKVVYLMQSIEYLDFSINSIKGIDVDGLRNMKKLQYLYLHENEIKEIPTALGHLINLKYLDINDNPFKRPSCKILRLGTEVVLKYLRKQYISED